MGRSVELLVTLERISDLWYIMDREKGKSSYKPNNTSHSIVTSLILAVAKQTLNGEFLKEILAQCSKYNTPTSSDTMDSVPARPLDVSMAQSCDTDIEQQIMQQVSATNNPFLTKAMDSFILLESSGSGGGGSDSVDAKSTTSSSGEQLVEWRSDTEESKTFEFLRRSEVVLPLRRIFESTLAKVLEVKFSGASKLVKNILTGEYKLEAQLKLMRSVYMMDTSHIMNKFCKLIFTEVGRILFLFFCCRNCCCTFLLNSFRYSIRLNPAACGTMLISSPACWKRCCPKSGRNRPRGGRSQ